MSERKRGREGAGTSDYQVLEEIDKAQAYCQYAL